jgi:hypothetical protein
MTTRYFSATDGTFTVFRATATRTYAAADWLVRDGSYPYCIGFKGRAGQGTKPAQEITKSEYEALTARKVTRIKAHGGDPRRFNSPQDSWVRNGGI